MEPARFRKRNGGAPIETLIKWNPRGGGAEAVIERALGDATLVWHHSREGKRTTVFEDTLDRRGDDGLARLVTQLELHRPLRLRLHHNCPPSDLRAALHIAAAESLQITASELAVGWPG